MATGRELADEYAAVMAEVIAAAGGCSDDEWSALCENEQRPVGVMFDHIAVGNQDVVGWIDTFLAGRPVVGDLDETHARNAAHADATRSRPRSETMAFLRDTTKAAEARLRALTAEQLAVRQSFSVAGEQDVAWVAGAAIRHPRRHLDSIRAALGR